jgi:hypothetical protein
MASSVLPMFVLGCMAATTDMARLVAAGAAGAAGVAGAEAVAGAVEAAASSTAVHSASRSLSGFGRKCFNGLPFVRSERNRSYAQVM